MSDIYLNENAKELSDLKINLCLEQVLILIDSKVDSFIESAIDFKKYYNKSGVYPNYESVTTSLDTFKSDIESMRELFTYLDNYKKIEISQRER